MRNYKKLFIKKNILFLIIMMNLSSCGLDTNLKTISLEKPIEISGCTLSYADNFDSQSTQEKGNCTFTRCLDETQDNFNQKNIQDIFDYINQYKKNKDEVIISNCNGRSACIHNLSKNKDTLGTKENGSCLFEACMDENFHEYMENDAEEIQEYLDQWGENYQNSSRIKSSCSKKRNYCKNAEASNYTGLNESRGEPYCIFHACTREKYEGYKKYLEFKEYLQVNPGEIIEDNSDSRCGSKLVSKNVKEIDINKQSLKTPVDVVFIIDDSRSMDDEIARVKEGLITISPTLKNFNAEINIELHKISYVNSNTKTTTINNIQKTEYLRPTSVHNIKIDGNSDLSLIENSISDGIDKVMSVYGNGEERGACYIQRILDSFTKDNQKNLITVLISDEDDHEKGSSKNCYRYSNRNYLLSPPNDFEHFPYQDSNKKDDLINVITEEVVGLDKDKKYGLTSIHWNNKVSTCINNLGTHAENYVRLIQQLSTQKKIASEGDICEKNYATLLDNTLADTIREIIGYKYLISSMDKNPILHKVELISPNQNAITLDQTQYEEFIDGNNLYIRLNENLIDLLKKSTKIRIHVTEDQ